MNGVHRFLSRRDKRPKSNGEDIAKDAGRLLHIPTEEKRKPDKEEDKRIKEVVQRLSTGNISIEEVQAEDVLRLPSVHGNVEKAISLLRLYDDASHGKVHTADPQLNMVGAVNRENVTCYLDSLLFSMFARTDSFEGILSAEFPDEPRKRLVTLLRLWVNMLRTGKLITTDITQKLQESLRECGWPEAALLRQQDVSEAFGFITGKLDLPLLTLKMDVYHTGKADRDDHRIVRERLLDVAIPPPPEDGSVIALEDCLEQYFNNKIEVKRHLQRRNTLQSAKPEKGMDVEMLEVAETPTDTKSSRPTEFRRRGQSIFGQRQLEDSETEKKTVDDIGIGSIRTRSNTIRREVLMPAWQFFSLIPWYTHDHTSGPKTDEQIVVHLQTKRPVLGICLKRYSMTATGVGSRLDTYIDIPLEIGVPHFISDDCGHANDAGFEPNFTNFKLSLLAVICHRGKSLDAGHYVALVRGREDNHGQATQWLRFDDLAHQRIASVDIHKALKDECPYLLFYQTRPIDDDDISEQDGLPTYDEATTDTSNGELSQVGTQSDISEPAVTTNVISVSGTASQETLTSASNTESETPPKFAAPTENTKVDVGHTESDSEPHTGAIDPPLNIVEVKPDDGVKPKAIDLAGLAAPNINSSKQSLDIPRGRSSFQGSGHRHSLSVEEVKKGGLSVPVTPDDNRTSWIQGTGNSRRNSLVKVWKPKSRPASQSGEGRINMNFIRTMISKDKLHDMNAGKDEQPVHTSTHFGGILEKPAEKESEATTDFPRRSKSLRHKKEKGKRSSSIGRMLDKNRGAAMRTENSKKAPDRECILM